MLIHLGPGHAVDHRVDRLEVRRVGGQLDRDRVAGSRLVNLPVWPRWYFTSPEPWIESGSTLPSNSLEELLVALADDVDEHVEPAAVGHADARRESMRAVGGLGEHGVEDRDGGLGALDAEALLAEVLGGEELLERLGRVEPVEDVALLVAVERRRGRPRPAPGSSASRLGSWMCMYSMPIVRQ